jgi:tetratricopeptide (TPR) repeat protein
MMQDRETPPHETPHETAGRPGARALGLALCAALAFAHAATAQEGAAAKTAPPDKGRAAQPQKGGAKNAATTRERRAKSAAAAGDDEGAVKAEDVLVEDAKAGSVKGDGVLVEDAKQDGVVTKDASKAGNEATAEGSAESSAAPRDGTGESKTKTEEVKTDAERARARLASAERMAADGQRDEAVAELRALLDEERVDPQGFYNLGNAFARLNESSAAVEAYRKAVAQRRGNYSRAQHNLGVVLIRLGRWEEAQAALAAAIRAEGGVYAEASYNLGRLHASRGEAGLAIAEWSRALVHRPDHADAAVALARALAEDGAAERALDVLDAFDARAARRGAAVPRSIEVARGEITAALNVAREGSAPVEREAGRSQARVERTSAAGPRAGAPPPPLRVPTLDQQSYDILRSARAAREGGRHEEAVAHYRRVVERHGGHFSPVSLELGFSLASLGRVAEAIAALQALTSKDGTRNPAAFYHLARLHETAGDLTRAEASFARAAALYGDENPQPLIDLSRVRERQGDLRGAADSMENYVRIMSRLGATPEWAGARLNALREKMAAPAAPQK